MSARGVGHNSLVAELADKMNQIRDRMKVAEKTGSARARWEILLSDMDPTDKFIALVMSCFADDGEEIQPTIDTLEVLTGYKKRRILGAIQQAKRADVIEQKAPAHRGSAAVYAFKIPDRTLNELAIKMHTGAPIMVKGCTPVRERVHGGDKRVHDGAERVHGDAPFSPVYIDNKNNNTTTSAQAPVDELVHVNGVGIIGPGFTLDYKTIEVCATLCSMSFEKGKLVAELAARRWAAAKFVPGSPNAVLRKVMAKERINLQIDQAKLEKELAELRAAPAEKPPTARSGGRVDYRAEQRREIDDVTEFLNRELSK